MPKVIALIELLKKRVDLLVEKIKRNWVLLLLTVVLFIMQIPFCLISWRVLSIFNYRSASDWDVFPIIGSSFFGFLIHLLLYILFKYTCKKKIHAVIIAAQLAAFAIFVPSTVDEFLHTSSFFATLAITFGSIFLFQAILFIAFTIAISLFDRHTTLKEWIKILISSVLALTVGLSLSAAVWLGLEKLYHYLS